MERGLEDMSSILKVEDLVKYYGEGENQVRAVDHTSLQIERGKFTAIVGRSGSGKSTPVSYTHLTLPTILRV